MNQEPRITSFGEHGILISWPLSSSLQTHQAVVRWKFSIEQNFATHILDCVPAYHSLAVYCKKNTDITSFIKRLEVLSSGNMPSVINKNYKYTLPVCYEGMYAQDIEALAASNKISVAEVVLLHTAPEYPVYFIGFLPGFPYLANLDAALHTPRKNTPNLKVPKGAVAIGGTQTGIYPSESPGGWQVIGNTPVPLFDVQSASPALLKAGDVIRFEVITTAEYQEIQTQIDNRCYQVKKEEVSL